ncbi:MAG TPA: hypothetical protein VHU84_14140 [Lacipirellulaceae bacterium]|nr:hypothetical protein [Lacipirellulaceae bacterium]
MFFTIPLLLVADFSRALGRSVSIGLVVWSLAAPIVGLVIDIARVQRAQSGPAGQLDALIALRPPFRFRLQKLFVVMLLVSVYCGFRFSGAVRQNKTVSELRAAGVPISYDGRNSSWLEMLFGNQMFGNVASATLRNDQEVAKVASGVRIRQVELYGPGITDASIKPLLGSTQLQKITLNNANVTPGGVDTIRRSLPNCVVDVYPP